MQALLSFLPRFGPVLPGATMSSLVPIAEVSTDTSDTSAPVPKCLGSEVSWHLRDTMSSFALVVVLWCTPVAWASGFTVVVVCGRQSRGDDGRDVTCWSSHVWATRRPLTTALRYHRIRRLVELINRLSVSLADDVVGPTYVVGRRLTRGAARPPAGSPGSLGGDLIYRLPRSHSVDDVAIL